MTFARGALTARRAEATDVGVSLLANLGNGDHDFYGLMLVEGREYRVRVWRQARPDGSESLRLHLSPRPAR